MKRTATSHWEGSATEGKGHLSTQSSALDQLPYSFKTRFENEAGTKGTNPEELIGAAHAGCYNMALSLVLTEMGFQPDELDTSATVQLEKVDDGFSITHIQLDLKAKVPNIEQSKFEEAAKTAKESCPLSKVLSGTTISLEAKLL